MLKGEVFERLNVLDSARNVYNFVINHFPSSIDTMYASWSLLRLDAIQVDTVYGFAYDSLMDIYFSRVVDDLKCPRYWFAAKRGEPEIERGIILQGTGNILYQNIPNPFSSETTIEFFIKEKCTVKIKVSDVLGRVIAVLVDEVKNKGQHSVTFRTDDFPAGLYYYSLEACGEVLTKQMQIIK